MSKLSLGANAATLDWNSIFRGPIWRTIAADLLCALGKTEALTSTLGGRLDLAELWLHAHRVRQLFVTGADGLHSRVWAELCALGERVGFDIVFVSAEATRRLAELADLVQPGRQIWLRIDAERPRVPPAVGAPLPDAGFPGLPAACAEHLDAIHGARALAIYDECLVAAFGALPPERLHGPPDAAHAFRCALARTPELGAVVLAMHAVRAAGLLRGYHISFSDDLGGVAFEHLLTADRLAQLSRLVAPEAAAAGVLAGIGFPSIPEIGDDGASVKVQGTWQEVPYGARPLLRAWVGSGASPPRPWGAPPRPRDERLAQLWRTPPPVHVSVDCEPIDCQSFRYIGKPPMDWTRPARSGRGEARGD